MQVVRGDAEIAGERELEADAERVAAELRDHRLRAPLRGGDVPREPRDLLGMALEEAGDVAAGSEGLACPGEHDRPQAVVSAQRLEHVGEAAASGHRHAVELPRDVERDRRNGAVALDAEAVSLCQTATLSRRSSRRRILPAALFGSSSTNRYSRGRLKRASGEAKQWASSSSASVSASTTTNATTR